MMILEAFNQIFSNIETDIKYNKDLSLNKIRRFIGLIRYLE